MKNKFLVLGSNSFSGSNFINLLLKKNCEVVGISRSNEYNEIYLPYKKSLNLKSFKFFKIDINKDLNKILQVVKKFKPKYVVNYIAQGMVSESWLNPENWYSTNIVAQVKLYKKLSNFRFIKKFVHVTTPEVYGSQNSTITENFNFKPLVAKLYHNLSIFYFSIILLLYQNHPSCIPANKLYQNHYLFLLYQLLLSYSLESPVLRHHAGSIPHKIPK